MSYETCSVCGCRRWFLDTHFCPPRWDLRIPDWGIEDAEGYGDRPEEVAAKVVEELDDERDAVDSYVFVQGPTAFLLIVLPRLEEVE